MVCEAVDASFWELLSARSTGVLIAIAGVFKLGATLEELENELVGLPTHASDSALSKVVSIVRDGRMVVVLEHKLGDRPSRSRTAAKIVDDADATSFRALYVRRGRLSPRLYEGVDIGLGI